MIHLARATENRAQDAQKGRPARPQRAKRYGPHFVYPFALAMNLGERISPFSISNIRGVPLNVDLLSDARTTLASFFSILPMKEGRT